MNGGFDYPLFYFDNIVSMSRALFKYMYWKNIYLEQSEPVSRGNRYGDDVFIFVLHKKLTTL